MENRIPPKPDRLKQLSAEMDKDAAGIALTITEMYRFVMMTAAVLPKMELDTGTIRLKIDDSGIFFGIRHPSGTKRRRCTPHDFRESADEEEEGLLYDGD